MCLPILPPRPHLPSFPISTAPPVQGGSFSLPTHAGHSTPHPAETGLLSSPRAHCSWSRPHCTYSEWRSWLGGQVSALGADRWGLERRHGPGGKPSYRGKWWWEQAAAPREAPPGEVHRILASLRGDFSSPSHEFLTVFFNCKTPAQTSKNSGGVPCYRQMLTRLLTSKVLTQPALILGLRNRMQSGLSVLHTLPWGHRGCDCHTPQHQ